MDYYVVREISPTSVDTIQHFLKLGLMHFGTAYFKNELVRVYCGYLTIHDILYLTVLIGNIEFFKSEATELWDLID